MAKRKSVSALKGADGIFELKPEEVTERWNELTPREQEIAKAYAFGFKNATIAAQHEISTKTLDIHRANLCRKLGRIKPWGIGRYYFAARQMGLPVKPKE